jgi:hypothetical protein
MVSIVNPPQKTTFEAVQIKMGPEWYVRVTLHFVWIVDVDGHLILPADQVKARLDQSAGAP